MFKAVKSYLQAVSATMWLNEQQDALTTQDMRNARTYSSLGALPVLLLVAVCLTVLGLSATAALAFLPKSAIGCTQAERLPVVTVGDFSMVIYSNAESEYGAV